MSQILKKLERKVNQAGEDKNATGLSDLMTEIRDGIVTLKTIAENDTSSDKRIAVLERLLERMFAVVEKSSETTEDDQSGKEMERLSGEYSDINSKCERLEKELNISKEALLNEIRINGDLKVTAAKNMSMYEAEKQARIKAESMHKEMMSMLNKKEPVEHESLSDMAMKVERDGADKFLRLVFERK